jgi:hypothetical protein
LLHLAEKFVRAVYSVAYARYGLYGGKPNQFSVVKMRVRSVGTVGYNTFSKDIITAAQVCTQNLATCFVQCSLTFYMRSHFLRFLFILFEPSSNLFVEA